jgi:Icc-related predicted phosphoesterase
MAKNVDLVIGAGDFGALRQGLTKTIGWLRKIDKPTIVVPGNAESFEELKKACKIWPSVRVLHGTGTRIHEIDIFGIGGGIPITPFGSWSYDFSEVEATQLLSQSSSGGILVSHSPPYGLLDVSSSGLHLGSKAIREFIEKHPPVLVVCGHIHESAGKQTDFGSTKVINAGPDGVIYQWTENYLR